MSLPPRRRGAAHERRSARSRSWRSRVISIPSRGSRDIRHGDSNRATHRLSSLGAKVVVAAHPTDSVVMEDAMIIAIMLSVAGPIGGAAIAMAAGATTLVAGQFAFARSRSTILRTMIAAAFALPAAAAGYHLVLGLSAMGVPSDIWRHVFAMIGAAVVGSTAWARLVAQPSEQSCGCAGQPALPHS
jgi:hypothetical protein